MGRLHVAVLLRALGVKGHEEELRNASDEFSGHCLALTLLGSYLTDAYSGDIRRRQEESSLPVQQAAALQGQYVFLLLEDQ